MLGPLSPLYLAQDLSGWNAAAQSGWVFTPQLTQSRKFLWIDPGTCGQRILDVIKLTVKISHLIRGAGISAPF